MKILTERKGRYDLKAMKMGQTALARAFLHGQPGAGIAAEAKGKTPEEAMEALREMIGEVELERASVRRRIEETGFDVPTSAEFEDALSRVRVSDRQWDMLRAHAASGEEGLTAGELARAAAYKNYNAVNLQYGKLGETVAEGIGIDLPAHPAKEGENVATGVLAGPGETRGGEFVWVMHPELRAAIAP